MIPWKEVENDLDLHDRIRHGGIDQTQVGEVPPGLELEVLDGRERHHFPGRVSLDVGGLRGVEAADIVPDLGRLHDQGAQELLNILLLAESLLEVQGFGIQG